MDHSVENCIKEYHLPFSPGSFSPFSIFVCYSSKLVQCFKFTQSYSHGFGSSCDNGAQVSYPVFVLNSALMY